jgi:hypothetical protein
VYRSMGLVQGGPEFHPVAAQLEAQLRVVHVVLPARSYVLRPINPINSAM